MLGFISIFTGTASALGTLGTMPERPSTKSMNRLINFINQNFRQLKKTFYLDNVKVNISEENNGIRLTTIDENWFIPDQNLDETKTIIEKNFRIIKTHFHDKLGKIVTEADLSNISLKICIYYFQMYNHWRSMYKKERNRDLTFIQNDFDHPSTSDTIVDYFKSTYPENYISKCEVMLNMTSEQVKNYVIRKEEFDNR